MHEAILAFNVLQYVGYLMPRASSLERTMVSGKTEGRRRSVAEEEAVGWYH